MYLKEYHIFSIKYICLYFCRKSDWKEIHQYKLWNSALRLQHFSSKDNRIFYFILFLILKSLRQQNFYNKIML